MIAASNAHGAPPITAEVLEVRKIWDKGAHNAFTDLTRWNDKFYCVFREGRAHVSTDGKIRVLESKNADHWESAALIQLNGYDLRDAHLSVTPDSRLMLLGGAAPRKKDNQRVPTGTFVCFSKDGKQWGQPQIVVEPGRWLWRVTWHKAKAYGVTYGGRQGLELLVSNDGIKYQNYVPKLFNQGRPTEVTLRFDKDDICYALMRRDRRPDEPRTTMLGTSRADYKKWQWCDLGTEFNSFGGPNFIRLPSGHWLGAGRMHQGGAHTALTYIDVKNCIMTKLVKLPSGGDTSYPGLIWHNNILYVSYYSSHEGKTSIYLAKVKVKSKTTDEESFGAEINPTGEPIGGGYGYSRLVNCKDYYVKTLEELLDALRQAQAGQVVYIDDKAEIDLTGKQKIVIPGGVTLASCRGREDLQGALLFSNELATSGMFLAGGARVRLTGLRLRGPDQTRRTEQMRKLHKQGRYYSIPNSDGIISTHPHLEVDNCELWGFSHAAVFLRKGASKAHIHHNYIHHNQRSGLGYGVCLDQADAIIEANLFDWCRHHIAATGRPGTSYEARYNLVLENANGHSFDMHGGKDRKDGTDIAGDFISIHHNTFRATGVRAIVIRGKPRQKADIHHNWFLHSDHKKAIAQVYATGNMNVYRNQFSAARIVKD